MTNRTVDEALKKVNQETEAILSECDPRMIGRTEAAIRLLMNDEYYRVMELDKLHDVSAYCFSRFAVPSDELPIEHWLLGAVTTAAQVGYLLGVQEMKGAF